MGFFFSSPGFFAFLAGLAGALFLAGLTCLAALALLSLVSFFAFCSAPSLGKNISLISSTPSSSEAQRWNLESSIICSVFSFFKNSFRRQANSSESPVLISVRSSCFALLLLLLFFEQPAEVWQRVERCAASQVCSLVLEGHCPSALEMGWSKVPAACVLQF